MACLFRTLGLACLLAAAALLVAGCEGGDTPGMPDLPASGVTDTEVRIGSSLALSGHAKYLGIQTLRGALSYIDRVNAQGGVHGRRIKVVAYDDAYDPPECVVNTQRLIVQDQVFALFCYVGTPTTVKILPLVEQARIPLIGMFTGANALRVPFNRYLINVRASYYQETEAMVKHLVEDLDLKKIAVFYQYDAFGFDGLTGTELALKRYGLAPVARGTYVRGTMNIEEGLHKIVDSGAQAVVIIGTYDPCAKFIMEARAKGFDPLFYTISFVGAEELARRLSGERGEVLVMSQVVPPPNTLAPVPSLADQADYIELLKKRYPDDEPNFIGLEGFFNAKVLVEGLRRAGPNLTREGFITAIDSIDDFSLAESLNVSFSPTDHQGLDKVYFTRLSDGRFSLITDWQAIRLELQAKQQAAGKGRGQ